MNVILPVAGLGTRLRPQTWSRPKPLVTVAGKTLLDHVIERLSAIDLDRVVFVTGYLGDQIEEYVRQTYPFEAWFIEQPEPLGQSDAIVRARELVSGPTLVLFPDMIFEADLSVLGRTKFDAGIFTMEVDDPSRFGVAVTDGDRIIKLVEKPDEPISNRAVVGIYYFADVAQLMKAIDRQVERDIQTQGELFLADAMQLMIDDGVRFTTFQTDVWQDCGTQPALLETNRYLLEQMNQTVEVPGATIIPPVCIGDGATIERSIVGPYASIGTRARIADSIVRDSIVEDAASVVSANIVQSVVGRRTVVTGAPLQLIVGDDADIRFP